MKNVENCSVGFPEHYLKVYILLILLSSMSGNKGSQKKGEVNSNIGDWANNLLFLSMFIMGIFVILSFQFENIFIGFGLIIGFLIGFISLILYTYEGIKYLFYKRKNA